MTCRRTINQSGIPKTRREKVCRDCRDSLPLSDFWRDGKTKDGHRGACKLCEKAKYQEWYYAAQRQKPYGIKPYPAAPISREGRFTLFGGWV